MLSLTIGLILALSTASKVSGQCSQNKYGPGCKYDCHCGPGVICNPQTGCNENCATGWDGATCQRQNVAMNRPTSQTGSYYELVTAQNFTSEYAVDGITGHNQYLTPCSHTLFVTPAAWTVTLDDVYNIYRFKIYNRDEIRFSNGSRFQYGARLSGFSLSVGNTSSQNYQVCYQDNTTSAEGPGAIIETTCNQGGPISGNSVRISLSSGQALQLCEVILYECVKSWWGELCSHTCGHCWNNNACDKQTGACPLKPGEPRCAAGYHGSQCMSTCNTGTYGPDCAETCGSCVQGMAVCNIKSGDCPDVQPRCMPGQSGSKCKTVCPDGTYGNVCEERCGRCYGGNLTCDHRNGFCPNCAAGWQGDLCNQVCSLGTYGPNCKLTCSVNCLDGPTGCDIFSDLCIRGCHVGYTGNFCDQPITIVVVASVIGVVVVMVLVIGIIILRRRSQGRAPTEISPTSAQTTTTMTNISESTITSVIPESDSTSDTPNYYNIDKKDDNEYECVVEKKYNTIRFSQVEEKATYSQIS